MRSLVAALIYCAFGFSVAAHAEEGMASVDYGRTTKYDARSYGGKVATGARFRASVLAVAHRTLPLGSLIMVTYRGRSAVALVNDRGPCLSAHCQRTAPARVRARILDMTPAVAARLHFPGLGRVTFWPIHPSPRQALRGTALHL
jgi:rare lipoprotein A (peptidoglycan hydrolase)